MTTKKFIQLSIFCVLPWIINGQTLLSPENESKVPNSNLFFLWDASDIDKDTVLKQYVLIIKEVYVNQNEVTAMLENNVVYETEVSGIQSINLVSKDVTLKNSQRYVWQIITYSSNGKGQKKRVVVV
ncbi:MAG TPA: hypothetical protein VK168_02130 [Saprospiraceae bacterium]|nr:hypothetical protein [Saprospiraceae bacterium]